MRIDSRVVACFVIFLIRMTTCIGPARAVDRVVEIQCVGTMDDCRFDIQPNPVVLVAGEDRVRWNVHPCTCFYWGMTVEVCPWQLPYDCMYVDYRGGSTPAQGPFCEPGTLVYYAGVRGSHGEIVYGTAAQIQVVAPGPATTGGIVAAPRIGVFADSTATSCRLLSGEGFHRAWVFAVFDAPVTCALAAVEFRITGFPEEWTAAWKPQVRWPDPGDSSLNGTGLLQDGERLSFPVCRGTPSGAVLLYTIDYYATTRPVSSTVRVEGPAGSRYPCPRAILCNGSDRVETCAIGGLAYFNMAAGACAVGVTGSSWTAMKMLYRDTGASRP